MFTTSISVIRKIKQDKMKKEYQRPSTFLVKMETEGDFLMDSAHGSHHEGFTETHDPNLRVEDGTNDDSPF